MGKVNAAGLLGKLRGSVAESKEHAAADKAQRAAATTILHPNEVYGEYDAKRVLTTTLRGAQRAITREDLIAFRRNTDTVKKRYKTGIRARQVIDMSLPVDRDRAKKEIRMAVPSSSNGGLIRFITNAGPNSNVTRHHVLINFGDSFAAATSAGSGSSRQMASWLRKEPLKFDCDCGRHRYWYRYISSIGKFNAGRNETGYPKIRNPRLHGVACKHVIRVMSEIESSGTVLAFLTRMIEKARGNDSTKVQVQNKQKEAELTAAQQSKKSRTIKTTKDRAREREAAKARKALAAAAQAVPPPKKVAKASRKSVAQVAMEYNMTPSELRAFLETRRKE